MTTEFTIEAAPGTDVWRKPPQTNIFNAPRRASNTTISEGNLSAFRSARISFSGPWSYQYDQAGIILSLFPKELTRSLDRKDPPPKWVKAGVELYQGSPRLSVVGCDSYADWSVTALANEAYPTRETWTTLQIEKSTDGLGTSLWVYQIVGQERIPLREICWVYSPDLEGWGVAIEAYAARPKKDLGADGMLAAKFRDIGLVWAD